MSDAFALFLIESSTVRASLQQCVSKLAGSDAEGALNTAIASADQAVKVNEQLEVLYRNLQKEASKLQTNKDPDSVAFTTGVRDALTKILQDQNGPVVSALGTDIQQALTTYMAQAITSAIEKSSTAFQTAITSTKGPEAIVDKQLVDRLVKEAISSNTSLIQDAIRNAVPPNAQLDQVLVDGAVSNAVGKTTISIDQQKLDSAIAIAASKVTLAAPTATLDQDHVSTVVKNAITAATPPTAQIDQASMDKSVSDAVNKTTLSIDQQKLDSAVAIAASKVTLPAPTATLDQDHVSTVVKNAITAVTPPTAQIDQASMDKSVSDAVNKTTLSIDQPTLDSAVSLAASKVTLAAPSATLDQEHVNTILHKAIKESPDVPITYDQDELDGYIALAVSRAPPPVATATLDQAHVNGIISTAIAAAPLPTVTATLNQADVNGIISTAIAAAPAPEAQLNPQSVDTAFQTAASSSTTQAAIQTAFSNGLSAITLPSLRPDDEAVKDSVAKAIADSEQTMKDMLVRLAAGVVLSPASSQSVQALPLATVQNVQALMPALTNMLSLAMPSLNLGTDITLSGHLQPLAEYIVSKASSPSAGGNQGNTPQGNANQPAGQSSKRVSSIEVNNFWEASTGQASDKIRIFGNEADLDALASHIMRNVTREFSLRNNDNLYDALEKATQKNKPATAAVMLANHFRALHTRSRAWPELAKLYSKATGVALEGLLADEDRSIHALLLVVFQLGSSRGTVYSVGIIESTSADNSVLRMQVYGPLFGQQPSGRMLWFCHEKVDGADVYEALVLKVIQHTLSEGEGSANPPPFPQKARIEMVPAPAAGSQTDIMPPVDLLAKISATPFRDDDTIVDSSAEITTGRTTDGEQTYTAYFAPLSFVEGYGFGKLVVTGNAFQNNRQYLHPQIKTYLASADTLERHRKANSNREAGYQCIWTTSEKRGKAFLITAAGPCDRCKGKARQCAVVVHGNQIMIKGDGKEEAVIDVK